MVVNDELIERLQELAKLDLDVTEREKLKHSIREMIEMFELVLDEGNHPMISHQSVDSESVLRNDDPAVITSDFLEKGLGIHFKNQFFSVPKVKKD